MSLKNKGENIKTLIQDIKAKTFSDEIENDKVKVAAYLERYKEAIQIHGEDHEIVKQEKLSTDVFKRVLIIAASNEINIQGLNETQKATQNNLPASSYLAHGGRIKIELPSDSDDSLINWITSGDKNIDGKSRKQDQNQALKEEKIVYNRSAATHDVSRKKSKDNSQYELIEKKGFFIGFFDYTLNKFFGVKTNHYGVDLALNAEFGLKDSLGNIVAKPDGEHGHLYIHYKPAKPPKPGSILIGIEGAAPSSPKHSKTGASDPVTPIDGSKFRDLLNKKQNAAEKIYENTVIPKKIDGMNIQLSAKAIDDLTQINANNYGPELARIMPSKSVDEFKIKVKNRDFHVRPEIIYEIQLYTKNKKQNINQNNKDKETKEMINTAQSIKTNIKEKTLKSKFVKVLTKAVKVGRLF